MGQVDYIWLKEQEMLLSCSDFTGVFSQLLNRLGIEYGSVKCISNIGSICTL